jgi:hypothetical protein
VDSEHTTTPSGPERDDVIPGSCAVHVTDRRVRVWEYSVDVSAPDGAWESVESFDRDAGPTLTLEGATPTAPAPDGYWLYARSYDCERDCE